VCYDGKKYIRFSQWFPDKVPAGFIKGVIIVGIEHTSNEIRQLEDDAG